MRLPALYVSTALMSATLLASTQPAHAQEKNATPKHSPAQKQANELLGRFDLKGGDFSKAIRECDIQAAESHYREMQDLLRQMKEMLRVIDMVGGDSGLNKPSFRYAIVLREDDLDGHLFRLRKAKFECAKKERDKISTPSGAVPPNGEMSGGVKSGAGSSPPHDKGAPKTDGLPEPKPVKSSLPNGASLENRRDEASANHSIAALDCDEATARGWLKTLNSIVEEYRSRSEADGAGEADKKAYRGAKEMLERAKRLHRQCEYKPIDDMPTGSKSETDRSGPNRESQSSDGTGDASNRTINRTSSPQSAAAREVANKGRGERFNNRVDQLLEQLADTKKAYAKAYREGNVEQVKVLGDELIDINDQYRNLALLMNNNVALGTVNDAVENELKGTNVPDNIDQQDLFILNAESEAARSAVIEDRRALEETEKDQSAMPQPQIDVASNDPGCGGLGVFATPRGDQNNGTCSRGSVAGSFGFTTLEVPAVGIGFQRSGPVGSVAEEFALQSDTSIETFGGSVNVDVGNVQFGFGYVEGSSTRTATIKPNAGIDSGIVFSELRSGSSGVNGGQLGGVASFNTDFNSFSASGGLCVIGCNPQKSGPVPIPYPTDRTSETSGKVAVSGARVMIKASASFTDTRHRGAFDTKFALPGFTGSFGQTRDTRISEDRYGVSVDGSVNLSCLSERVCSYVGGYAGIHYSDVKIRAAERNMASFVPAPDRDFTLRVDQSDNRVGAHAGLRVGLNYIASEKIPAGSRAGLAINIEGKCDYLSDVSSVGFNNSGDQTLAGDPIKFGKQGSFSCGASLGVKVPF